MSLCQARNARAVPTAVTAATPSSAKAHARARFGKRPRLSDCASR